MATERGRCRHQEFLGFAMRVLQDKSIARRAIFATIWLRDWEQGRWVLDVCETHDGPLPGETRALTSLAVAETTSVDHDRVASSRIACEISPEIVAFAVKTGADAKPESFPFFYSESDEGPPDKPEDLRGFLQIWTSVPLTSAERELLRWLARFIAVGLRRHRRYRELQALRSLQAVFSQAKDRNVENWLRTAAKALGESTHAEHCLIFMPGPDEKLQAQVVWSLVSGQFHPKPAAFVAGPHSVVRRVYETRGKLVRLADFKDEEERVKALETDGYDVTLARQIDQLVGTQKAWMAAPILTDDQALGVVVLQSKNCNLPQQFSATDERILSVVCSYLGNVLSSALAEQFMDATLAAPATPVLQRNLMNAAPAIDQVAAKNESLHPVEEIQRIFDTLQRHVPNVSGAALWIKGTFDGDHARVEHFGGDDFLSKHPEIMKDGDETGYEVNNATRGSAVMHYVVLEVPDLEGMRMSARVGVTLHQGRLGKYERKMLQFWVKTSLTFQLRARGVVEGQVRQLNELRHNIRGGIHGMQHLTTALNLFTHVQQLDYKAPRPVLQQVFKSIRRAWFYTEQTRLLVEASRFLFSSALSRSDLRLTKDHVGEVAREVIQAVRIEAERFRVVVDLDDQIPRNEKVDIDREGIYILFFNLVENAVKYSVEGEHVRVRLWLHDRRWHFAAENVGPALDEQTRQDIFIPFVRRFASKGRKARAGTGLGLSTCRLIVQAHEGEIEVASVSHGASKKTSGALAALATNTFTVSIQRWFAV